MTKQFNFMDGEYANIKVYHMQRNSTANTVFAAAQSMHLGTNECSRKGVFTLIYLNKKNARSVNGWIANQQTKIIFSCFRILFFFVAL